jgi:uncharacterized membrane protein YedE/YeeE
MRNTLVSTLPWWMAGPDRRRGRRVVCRRLLIGVGARTAGGCTSGHGLTGSALISPASIVAIMASAITTTVLLEAVV